MSDTNIAPLVEGEAVLRMLEERDLPLTLAWRNHPQSRRWFHSDSEIEWPDHVAWYEQYLRRVDDHVFVLTVDDVPVAQVSLYDISAATAEFGRLLVDPESRGRGTGRLASRLCLRVADETLEIEELRLEVKEDNAAAIRIYLELGFEVVRNGQAHAGALLMRRRRA